MTPAHEPSPALPVTATVTGTRIRPGEATYDPDDRLWLNQKLAAVERDGKRAGWGTAVR